MSPAEETGKTRRPPSRRARPGPSHGIEIERETAIVLRITPVTETSCMVFWLTAQGRLVTLVKGAYRRKSPFLGFLDVFRTCELLYYPSRRAERPAIAREIVPLQFRNGLRTRWRAAAAASYLCDLAGRVFLEVSGPNGLETLTLALDALDAGRGPGSVLIWFELRLADMLGWRPRFASCAACGKEAAPISRTYFSPSMGGLLCADCRGDRTRDARLLSPRLRQRLLDWQAAETPDSLPEARLGREDIETVEQALADFLQFHLELDVRARRLAFHSLTGKGLAQSRGRSE